MARVSVFQGGRVRLQPGTEARQRTVDYGPGALSVALQAGGKGLAQVADTLDQVEDFKARVEANRLAVEFDENARLIGNEVKQTLGEGAEAKAAEGATRLDKAGQDILSRATPRARLLLESTVNGRSVIHKDSYSDHGFRETVKAFDTSSTARIKSIAETAADEDDEDKAALILGEAGTIIDEQARRFGRGAEWADSEKRELKSGTLRSRALKLANGPNGSALAAIEYATKHRENLTDQDYNTIVSAYNDNALDEVATAERYGANSLSSTVTEGRTENGEPPRKLDAKAFFDSFTVPHEGSTYVVDSNGHGAKFGINAQYNPGVDVKNLTKAKAFEIFQKNYFEKSGADKLPPALAAVHVDTFYLNEKQAMRMLKESGGDPDKYIQLRNTFLNGLARGNPAKFGRYQKGWQNRTNALKAFADRQGGDGTSQSAISISVDTDLTDFKRRTMQRTDIGLALKTKIIQGAEAERSDLRQERSIREEAAADELTKAEMALEGNFTDVKQLPQSAFLNASPAVQKAYRDRAQNNRDNRPIDQQDALYIDLTRLQDPKKFASKGFIQELVQRGVPTAHLRNVMQEQNKVAVELATAKPDAISSGQVWGIAKEAFEAQGLLFDSIQEKKPSAIAAERQADFQKKSQAINFILKQHSLWAAANPGKKADETTVKQWVGYALRQTSGGLRGYELSDVQFLDRVPPAEVGSAVRALRQIYPNWNRMPSEEKVKLTAEAIRNRASGVR